MMSNLLLIISLQEFGLLSSVDGEMCQLNYEEAHIMPNSWMTGTQIVVTTRWTGEMQIMRFSYGV